MTTTTTVTDDPVLKRFRHALHELYGDRLERVVLFGSRARGDAHEDSDYDIAVFLKDMTDRWAEMKRLAHIQVSLLDYSDAFIDSKAFPSGAYNERTPLVREIRREGIDL